MVLPPKVIHPKGDTELSFKKREISALVAYTFDRKIHIEWDPQAQVTPLGTVAVFYPVFKNGPLIRAEYGKATFTERFDTITLHRTAFT